MDKPIKQLVAIIGDIEVLADDNFVYVTIDDEPCLCIPREGHGLDKLTDALRGLVK